MDIVDLIIPSNANKSCQYSGMDTVDLCMDLDHFKSYPYNVNYNYNSRGFRGQEWPSGKSDLADAIWCVGDSFTVGIGAPIEHTWPEKLAALTNRRTINVSMDGASNEWIARTTKKIVNAISPRHIVVMWSFTHRREHPDTRLDDSQRIQHYVKSTVEQDWDNFLQCKHEIQQLNSNIIEFAVPNFHSNEYVLKIWNSLRGADWPQTPPDTLDEFLKLPHGILSELKHLHNCFDNLQDIFLFQQQLWSEHNVIAVNQKDHARDGFHFDLITAEWAAGRALTQLDQ